MDEEFHDEEAVYDLSEEEENIIEESRDDLLSFLDEEPQSQPKKSGIGLSEKEIEDIEKTQNIKPSQQQKKPQTTLPKKISSQAVPSSKEILEEKDILGDILSKQEKIFDVPKPPPSVDPKLKLQNDVLGAIMKHMKTSHIVPQEKKYSKKYDVEPSRIQMKKKEYEKLESGSTIYKKLEGLFSSLSSEPQENIKNIEIEASFGNFNKSFFPGIKSLSSFKFVNDYLKSTKGLEVILSNDVVYMIEGYNIRKIQENDGNIFYEKKTRDLESKIDIDYLGVRVSKSEEIKSKKVKEFEDRWRKTLNQIEKYDAKNVKEIGKEVLTVLRHRTRTSYLGKTTFNGLRFDLTFIEEYRNMRDGSSTRISKQELEIESKNFNIKNFVEGILLITKILQDSPKYPLCKNILCDIIPKYEIKNVIRVHNHLFQKDMSSKGWTIKDPYRLYEGYWNKPVNVKVNNLTKENLNEYAVTVKLDGVRKYILFIENFVYMLGPPYDVTKIGVLDDDSLNGTLLDCEFIRKTKLNKIIMASIYIFDILFYKNKDVRTKKFNSRMEYLDEINKNISHEKLFVKYHNKIFYTEDNFYDNVQNAFGEITTIQDAGINTDGLIFQPPGIYFNNETYKWKEVQNLTIDFLLIPFSEKEVEILSKEQDVENKFAFWLKVGGYKGSYIFKGTDKYPFSGALFSESDELDGQTISNKIVECSWDSENGEFIPVRIRNDRSQPNNLSTARDVWNDIMKPILLRTIIGEDLLAMRHFHNMVKSEILNKEFNSGDIILDIGSGRGGDLRKWEPFKKVYAVEPSSENFEELEKRMSNLHIKNVTPLNIGVEQTDKIKDILRKDRSRLDGIVSFFSMTYFTKGKKIYRKFLNTLKLLPTGSKFVGIVLDGKAVKYELDEVRSSEDIQEDDVAILDNSAFTIEQVTMFDDTRYGNEIKTTLKDESSMVKEQSEYLFYFDLFVEDMKENGFILEKQKFLDEGDVYKVLPDNARLFSRLNRSFVFIKTNTILKIAVDYKNDFIDPSFSTSQLFNNPYSQKNLYYIGVESEASSFAHSILYLLDENYRTKTEKVDKINLVLEFRRKLSEFLTKDIFLKMHGGEFSRKLYTPYMYEGKTKEESIDIALLKFKNKLITKNENVPLGEISLLEIASLYLKKNIYILNLEENFLPSRMFDKDCDFLYNFGESILIIKNEYIYYPIFRENESKKQYTFDSSDSLIETIKSEVCLY